MSKLSLDAFTLKIIAIVSMGLHHIAMVLWPIVPMWIHTPLGFLRGVTFPIMAFFVVEGFRRTSNMKRYMARLLIFGAIAQIPYMFAFGMMSLSGGIMLNIVFAIAIGLVCLILHKKLYIEQQKKALFVIIFIAILIISTFLVEGAFGGPILIFLYNVIKDEMRRRTVPLIIFGAFAVLMSLVNRVFFGVIAEYTGAVEVGIMAYEMMMATRTFVVPLGTFMVIPLLRAYNGELGKRAKYLFYAFYPGHFIILAWVALVLGII